MERPLADRARPRSLDDVVGQSHLIGPGALLRDLIENGKIPNMVFYGPSGVGKTTVADIIAERTNRKLHRLNATTASLSDIKSILEEPNTLLAPNGVLLYLDEIQYFNKKQQQSLLEVMENGQITLIASTTENPYFYIYNAILSRSTVFEFKPVDPADVAVALRRIVAILEQEMDRRFIVEDSLLLQLARAGGGDVRKSINVLELIALSAPAGSSDVIVTADLIDAGSQRSAARYDRDGDAHYDILSAFQKSVRGSDPNAAVHYLARLLEAGDLISACRRLLVMASEDVGLAYPLALPVVKAAVDSAMQLGLPEARIPLAQAAVLLATSPKSNASYLAIDRALADIRAGKTGDIPSHLKDAHYSGAKKMGRGLEYLYPHDYPNHYIGQQYLPDAIKDAAYYVFGDNKAEQAAAAYWNKIKGTSAGKNEEQSGEKNGRSQ